MPKRPHEIKRAVGVSEKVYLEMEEYARKCNPQLFLYEVIDKAWLRFKDSEEFLMGKWGINTQQIKSM